MNLSELIFYAGQYRTNNVGVHAAKEGSSRFIKEKQLNGLGV
jgi:hypothetical protein